MERSTLNSQVGSPAARLPKPIGIYLSVERSALSVQRSALSVERYHFSLLFFFLLATPLFAADVPWRTYAVYQPTIQRAIVVDAAAQPLRYNHDSSAAWFRDRWLCLWNANAIPLEGAPGQLNFESTSPDGLAWSAPRPAFSDPARSADPIPCAKGTQWQPNLLVVGSRLWCLWSQNSKDEYNGCYFSTLDAPDGLWTNRLLTWEGRADPVFDGKPFRLFPTQNPLRLSTGRVLAPVTMMGPVSTNAPAGKSGWQWLEKRNSVLFTDDGGATWRVSPGTTLPGLDWRQWEPTVLEQPDGTVLMFARNNAIPALEPGATIRPAEALTWSLSRDGGATWSPLAFVPLETVVSRMHLLRQPGSDRSFMLHNDWPAGTFGADRRNLALFVNRGGGFDFTAGLGLTGREPEVAYPQMDLHDNALLFTYSQGACGLRNIRAVRVSPLPDPDQLYLCPRSNLPAPPQCAVTNGVLTLCGGRSLKCRAAPAVQSDRFRAEAEINPDDDGVLFDNRSPAGGVVWGLSGVAFVHLGDPDKNIRSTLPVPRGRWSRAGVAVDYSKGEVVFAVNDTTERVTFTPGRRSLAGKSATLFGPNLASSRLTAFEGAVRSLTLDGTNRLFDAAARGALAPFGGTSGTAEQRASETSALTELLQQDEKTLLRFAGDASAGVELPANERAAGDAVDFEFAFRLERAATGMLCTVGDAIESLRVSVCGTNIVISTLSGARACGPAAPGAWQRLSLHTQAVCTRVTLDAHPPAEIRHTPQATWLYLGEGYPSGAGTAADVAFDIDVASVRTRIIHAVR
jgi:hypothetical protein